MAGYLDRGFDLPVAIDPKAPRNATFAYNQGLLTGVSANGVSYGTLSYHSNLLVSQVTHGNGVMETQGNDPNQMRRPASLSAAGPYAAWSSGAYAYDGAGNVKTIGTSTFTYDKVNRLVSASLFDGPTGSGNLKQQSYTFDAHGNLTAITGTSGRNIPTSAGTNRLNALGTAYDAAGNLTSWNGAAYEYDRFNQMTHMTSGGEDWFYLYTADDERIWSFSSALSRWTLRDLGGKVLREYLTDARGWSVGTDYLYRGGLLLAAETQTGRRHFHLDHLGTPRLITRASGDRASYHVYYPFGEEATAFNQDSERMKFTGHERDLGNLTGAGDDLDYMHARHESPVTGRFMGVDPSQGGVNPKASQTWNRYAYALNNPLRYVDLDGRVISPAIFEDNEKNRTDITVTLSRLPVIGFGLAAAADILLADVLPANPKELSSSVSGSIFGMAGFGLGNGVQVVSRIGDSTALSQIANKIDGPIQRSVDSLTAQLSKGNLDPGIGTKHLFNGVFEARARDGGRVYFRLADGKIELLAKSTKSTQKRVINILQQQYGQK